MNTDELREKLRHIEQTYPGLLDATLATLTDTPPMQEEVIGLVRCWPMYHSSSREQVWAQNRADEEFDWYVSQAHLLGMAVSSIKRSLRISKDEDGCDRLAFYSLRTKITGSQVGMQYLKDIFDKKRPPLSPKLDYLDTTFDSNAVAQIPYNLNKNDTI